MSSIQTEIINEFLSIDINDIKNTRYELDQLITLKPDIDERLLDVAFDSLRTALFHHPIDTDPTEIERSVIVHEMLTAVNDWIINEHKLNERKDLLISMETNLSIELPDNKPLHGYADYTLQRDSTYDEKDSGQDELPVPAPTFQFTSQRLILTIAMKRDSPINALKQSVCYLERVKRVNRFKKYFYAIMCNLKEWALLKLELGEEDTPRVFKMSNVYDLIIKGMGDEPEDAEERKKKLDRQKKEWKEDCADLVKTLYTIVYNDLQPKPIQN